MKKCVFFSVRYISICKLLYKANNGKIIENRIESNSNRIEKNYRQINECIEKIIARLIDYKNNRFAQP